MTREPDPTPVDADGEAAPLDPAAALRLVRDQQLEIETRVGGFVPTIMLVWGIAWLFGFGAVWLSEGMDAVAPVVASTAVATRWSRSEPASTPLSTGSSSK